MIFRRSNKEKKTKEEEKDIIAWRGHEVTRIEAFSDAVFGFAITLMVVSLEVPKKFDEMLVALRGFIPFAICFILFFQIWTAQNLFFRRYGLHDERTLTLNAMLLFAVLFYVYPLKFLWVALFYYNTAFNDPHEQVVLMYIYGAGFACIYFLLALMYHHANRKRKRLKLTNSEAFETRTYMYRHIGMGMVGLLSMAIASLGHQYVQLSGMSYAILGLVVGMTHGKRRKIHNAKYTTQEMQQALTDDEPRGEKLESE